MLSNLKTQADLHLARKVFHFLSILGILLCMIVLPVWLCWTLYVLVGLPLVGLDFFRRYSPDLNRCSLKVFGPVIRKHELKKLTGSSYAILGIGLCFLIFSKPISLLAVLFLGIGDPIATLFGLLFGRRKILGNKSFFGTAAAFGFCSLGAFIFLSFDSRPLTDPSGLELAAFSLACGAIGAVSELLSFWKLDDNLSQPVVSGVLLTLLFMHIGGGLVF
jgi:dolichol kinase